MSSSIPEIKPGITQVHAEVISQLDEISLNPNKPLLICDADEVILDFLGAFESYLLSHKLKFDLSTYSLFGNILSIDDNNPISKEDVIKHLENFFDVHTKDISIVPGAYENLKKIENELDFQIIILTNVPIKKRSDRIICFKKNNLDYPVIANINSKGPTIRNLILNFNKEVYFIDDMIFNLKSTYEEVPRVKLIHYVSDKRLEKLIETPKNIAKKAISWDEIYKFIKNGLD